MDSFRTSVIDNLGKAFSMIMMAFEDEELAKEILRESSQDFKTLQFENFRKIRDQKNWISKQQHSKLNETGNNRKKSGKRKYVPTGANLFYYLIRERIAVEAQKREILRRQIHRDAIMYFLFHKLFENDYIIKGAFVPMIATFQVLYNVHPDLMPAICAHVHGIDEIWDKKERDYRDSKYFVTKCAKLISDFNRHFADSGFFETVPLNELPVHDEIKIHLDKDIESWIKFELATEETRQLITNILKLFAPWGSEPLGPNDIPKYNLRNNRIPKLVREEQSNSETTLIHESRIESLRTATVMNLEFVEALLTNESVRKNNMNTNLYAPVLKADGSGFASKVNEITPLDSDFIFSIAMDELSKPYKFRQLKDCNLAVEVDQQEIGTIESTVGKGKIAIPKDSRIVRIVAKIAREGYSEIAIPLATVLIGLTNLADGETWISESHLENNYHLGLRLVPVFDSSNNFQSIDVSLDYHQVDDCRLSQNDNSFLKKTLHKVAAAGGNFSSGGLVSKAIENFLNNIEAVDAFSVRKARKSGLKSSLAFTLIVNIFTITLLVGIHFFREGLGNYLIIPEIILTLTMISVTLVLIVTLFVSEKKGINQVFRFCNQFSFLSGMVSLVLMTSIFTYSWNRLESLQYARLVDLERLVAPPTVTSEFLLSKIIIPEEQKGVTTEIAQLQDNAPQEINAVETNYNTPLHIGTFQVNVKIPPVRYLSEKIDIDTIKKGTQFRADLDNQNSEAKLTNSNALTENRSNIPEAVFAKITFVDKNTFRGNDIMLRLKLEKLLMSVGNEKKTIIGNEYTVFISGDQKISQLALFLNEEEIIYAKSISKDMINLPSQVQTNRPENTNDQSNQAEKAEKVIDPNTRVRSDDTSKNFPRE